MVIVRKGRRHRGPALPPVTDELVAEMRQEAELDSIEALMRPGHLPSPGTGVVVDQRHPGRVGRMRKD